MDNKYIDLNHNIKDALNANRPIVALESALISHGLPYPENIEVAKLHSKEMGLDIDYIQCPPENLNLKDEFDVILNMEVVEHVKDLSLFIKSSACLLKKMELCL